MPTDDLIGLALVLAVMLIAVPLGVMHGMYRAGELSEALRKLADRHRLTYEPGRRIGGQPVVRGLLAGRRFEMKRGGGNNNKAPVHIELKLNGPVPDGLVVRGKSKVLARTAAALGHDPAAGGTTAIDADLRAESEDPEALHEYWNGPRRRAAAQLVELGGELDGRRLRVALDRKHQELDAIDQVVCRLERLAPQLDAR